MRATLLVAGIVAIFLFAFRFYQIVLIFLTAVILGIALKPIVLYFEKKGVPKSLGIILIYFFLIAIVGAGVWYGIPILADQVSMVITTLREIYLNLLTLVQSGNYRIVTIIMAQLPQELTNGVGGTAVAPDTEQDNGQMLVTTLATLSTVLSTFFIILVTFLLSFYWVREESEIKRRVLITVPSRMRETVETLWDEIERKVSQFLLGQTVLCFSIFITSFVAYLIIGLPNALLLAIFAGILEAVPNIGPVLGAVPAFIIALTISPMAAVYVVIATIIIQQLENAILFPRVMNEAVGVRPFVALLALLGFSTLFGLIGAILAIPLTAILQILLDYFLLNRDAAKSNAVEGRDQASKLQYETNELILDIRNRLRNKEDDGAAKTVVELEDSVEMIAVDLNSVILRLKEEREEEEKKKTEGEMVEA